LIFNYLRDLFNSEDKRNKSDLIAKVELDEDEDIVLKDVGIGKRSGVSKHVLEAFVVTKQEKTTTIVGRDDRRRSSERSSFDLASSVEKVFVPAPTSMKQGLTTGQFDIDFKLLRTCSEPDLNRFSCGGEQEGGGGKHRGANSADDVRRRRENEEVEEDNSSDEELVRTNFVWNLFLLISLKLLDF